MKIQPFAEKIIAGELEAGINPGIDILGPWTELIGFLYLDKTERILWRIPQSIWSNS